MKNRKTAIHPDAMNLPKGVQVQIRMMNTTTVKVTGIQTYALADVEYTEGDPDPRRVIKNYVRILYGAGAPLTYDTMEAALNDLEIVNRDGDLHEIVLAEF